MNEALQSLARAVRALALAIVRAVSAAARFAYEKLRGTSFSAISDAPSAARADDTRVAQETADARERFEVVSNRIGEHLDECLRYRVWQEARSNDIPDAEYLAALDGREGLHGSPTLDLSIASHIWDQGELREAVRKALLAHQGIELSAEDSTTSVRALASEACMTWARAEARRRLSLADST